MTNWKVYKVFGGSVSNYYDPVEKTRLNLDKYVEYRNEYDNHINVSGIFSIDESGPEGYVEIDLDKAKCYDSDHVFDDYAWRQIPLEIIAERNRDAMIKTSSADATALVVTRDGINRINRGEISEFEYKMVDNSGNRHQWIYRK